MIPKNKNRLSSFDKAHLDKVVLAQKVGKVFLEKANIPQAYYKGFRDAIIQNLKT